MDCKINREIERERDRQTERERDRQTEIYMSMIPTVRGNATEEETVSIFKNSVVCVTLAV